MSSLLSSVTQLQTDRVSQSIGTAVARQQMAEQKSVAAMVAQTAASVSPPAPPGQGQRVDRRV